MKRLFFCLLVICLTLIWSAFVSQKTIGSYYVQNEDGSYRALAVTNPEFCEISLNVCMFRQSTNETLAPILTYEEVQTLTKSGKLVPVVNPITSEPFLGRYVD